MGGEIAMALGCFPRRMTVVALANGGTAVWSAVPLKGPAMREIEALGPPEFLIAPGIAHRLDAAAWFESPGEALAQAADELGG